MAITEKYVSDTGGGAHDGSSEANAFSWSEMITDINAGGKAGLRYHVKGPSIAGGSALQTVSGSGSTTAPVLIRGYKTTIGDLSPPAPPTAAGANYLGRSFGNTGPLIRTNIPTVTWTGNGRLTISGSFIAIESLVFSGAFAGNLINLGADNAIVWSVVENNNSSAVSCILIGARSTVNGCDMVLLGGGTQAVLVNSAGGTLSCCRVTAPGAVAVTMSNNNANLLECVVFGSSVGVDVTATQYNGNLASNTVVDNTGDGLRFATQTGLSTVRGNLVTDNGGYGLNAQVAANPVVAYFNRLDRNASGNINLATNYMLATASWGRNTTSATKAQEYVDAANRDYRLGSYSPARMAGHWNKDQGAIPYRALSVSRSRVVNGAG